MAGHCERCGLPVQGIRRCQACRLAPSHPWIILLAALLWLTSVALYLAVGRGAYPDLAHLYRGLGGEPPLPARAYFAASGWLVYGLALGGLAGLVATVMRARSGATDAWTWVRGYAMVAIGAMLWASLGLLLWYWSIRKVIDLL